VGKLLRRCTAQQWAQAFREVNVNPDFYVYRPKEIGEILPWDFIDQGVEKAVLAEEYGQALSGATSG
jgi:hypothetical protein